MRFFSHVIAAAVLAALAPSPALAGHDADRARAALQAGEVLPLTRILQQVHDDFVGDVISIELDRDDHAWIYEIKLLLPKGAVLKLEYDARNASLLKAKGAGIDAARRR